MEQNDCVGGSGDVVIVVPSMDNLSESVVRADSHSHHICIDPEGEMVEPHSPKHMTESSSEFTQRFLSEISVFLYRFNFCDSKSTKLLTLREASSIVYRFSKQSHSPLKVQCPVEIVYFGLRDFFLFSELWSVRVSRPTRRREKMKCSISECTLMIKVCSSHIEILSVSSEWFSTESNMSCWLKWPLWSN